jgi:peroxygenase
LPGLLPDPFLHIYISRVWKNKLGSDSMSYDNEGRFRRHNFEDIFSKYDPDGKGGLGFKDLWAF